MSHCRVPMGPREATSAPCSWATYATAIASLWTFMPIKRVRDWDMVDLRVGSGCCDSMRLWLRVSSPALHRGSTSRHWKSLCLGFFLQTEGNLSRVNDLLYDARERRWDEVSRCYECMRSHRVSHVPDPFGDRPNVMVMVLHATWKPASSRMRPLH